MTAPVRSVALLVTCLVDALRPSVAEATVALLGQAGFAVAVPRQGCCGQPLLNAGDADGAADLAKRMIAVFAGFDFVVAPSGSCIATLREYARLFAPGSADAAAAQDLATRAFEICDFLDRHAPVLGNAPGWDASVTYHDACSGLRQLGIRSQPRALLSQLPGLELRELAVAEAAECCGFGGLFCVKYPAVSAQIADRKLDAVLATGADFLVGGDLGCLLHLEGRLQRRGLPLRAVHVAEALAGQVPGGGQGPADGSGRG